MEWIECNLPWTYYSDYKNSPKFPNLKKEIKKKFGKTQEQAYKELQTVTDNKKYKKCKKLYIKFCAGIDEWTKTHPLYLEYLDKIKVQDKEIKQKSFCGRELNKPGTLIEVMDNGKLQRLLIGDINTIGGVCDDCMGFSSKAIIIRYYYEYKRI